MGWSRYAMRALTGTSLRITIDAADELQIKALEPFQQSQQPIKKLALANTDRISHAILHSLREKMQRALTYWRPLCWTLHKCHEYNAGSSATRTD